jgi:hypothetical protein
VEQQKPEASENAAPASTVVVNGDTVDGTATTKPEEVNGESCAEADDEKMNEMFTDDVVNEMKQELGDDSKQSGGENKEEFSDQCDQKDSEALEMKMKNSEKTEALQLFQQGKRNLLIKDFDAAVETLASACEKFSSIYGELSAECGDVFMTYGHALIELWRYEESNKREDEESNETTKPANHDDTETKKVQESDAVATETNGEQVEEEPSETDEATAVEAATNGEENEDTEGTAANEETTAKVDDEDVEPTNEDTIEDESAEENDDEEDCNEDEVDNLQLAWEIFETARNIFMKHNDETNLAKVHTKLGEISIASGNYELAVEDLKKSLSILNKVAVTKPRQIADAHFQLYSAYSANYNFDLAEIELRNAKNILEEQLRTLDEKLKDVATESDEAKQINSEKKDLEELTKDMREKLVDLNSSKRQVVSAISTTIRNKMENRMTTPSIGEAAGSSGAPLSTVSNSSSSVPVNNISHLVRKKPKTSENGEKTEEEKKKTDDAVVLVSNGDVSKIVEETKSTNGNASPKVEEIVKSDVVINDSPTCKRKADDESEETESKAKKQCVS